MAKRNGQNKSRKLRFFLVLNFLVLFFLALAFGREYVGNIQIQHEIKELEEERAALETDQLNTLSLIESLSSEYYLETEARTKHGLAKEGETLIVVQQDGVNHGSVLGVQEDSLNFLPNYQRWFYYFFDKDRLIEDHIL